MKVIVTQIIKETSVVKRFFLSAGENAELPAFSAGSHIATYAGNHERNYSLVSGDPCNYEIAIRRENVSRGGSAYWHDQIRKGDKVEISYPKNHFPLSFRAKHHAFFAAGIGITPIMAMMNELTKKGGSFELHYAARSQPECAYYPEIRKNFRSLANFYFSKNSNQLSTERLFDLPIGTHVYFCGPEPFISHFTETALALGYPEGSIHHERFTAKPVLNPKPFQVELARSGRELTVPNDKSILDVLREAGVKIPYSCKVGECGTCELEVLKGRIDHYDSFLSEEEKEKQDTMLTCVSRCSSHKLTLNI